MSGALGGVPTDGNKPFAASRAIALTIGACFFMEGLDSTIVATSLPQIAGALDVSAAEIGVSLTAYLISVSLWMAASGWLADRFEARLVFIAAILVFMAGSLLCGLSQNLPQLIAGRFLQGMGGALMTPVGRLILARSFPRDELIRAMSYMIVPGLLGPTLGPIIGGWITTYFGWRWIFFINLPMGLVVLWLARRYLASQPASGTARFDWLGFVLVGFALVTLQTGLEIMASSGAVTIWALAGIAAGVASAALFARHADRRPDAILDPAMFRYRAFAVAVLGGSFSRVALGAMLFLFPLYFVFALGASAIEAGYLMGTQALGQIAMRFALTPLLKLGVKPLLIAGSLTLGAMLAGLLAFQPGVSLWLLGVFIFLQGLIHSIQLSTLGALNFSGIPDENLAKATSLAAVMQRLTTAFGISATAIILGFETGGVRPQADDFVLPILAMAAITLLSALSFLALRPGDGDDLMKKRR